MPIRHSTQYGPGAESLSAESLNSASLNAASLNAALMPGSPDQSLGGVTR